MFILFIGFIAVVATILGVYRHLRSEARRFQDIFNGRNAAGRAPEDQSQDAANTVYHHKKTNGKKQIFADNEGEYVDYDEQ